MEEYKKEFAETLAETGALFFDDNLILKDGRPSPYFVNMAMFKTGKLALKLGTFFAQMISSLGLTDEVDIILGPSYKGSSIALATCIALWDSYGKDIYFEYDRKEAKAHGESSGKKSLFVNKTFFDGCKIFVVDDVATSMATKYDLLEKISIEAKEQSISYKILGIGIGIDREQTTAVYDSRGRVVFGQKGKDAVREFVSKTGIEVFPLAGISEIITYLFEEKIPVLIKGNRRPIDEQTKQDFDTYLETYGSDRD